MSHLSNNHPAVSQRTVPPYHARRCPHLSYIVRARPVDIFSPVPSSLIHAGAFDSLYKGNGRLPLLTDNPVNPISSDTRDGCKYDRSTRSISHVSGLTWLTVIAEVFLSLSQRRVPGINDIAIELLSLILLFAKDGPDQEPDPERIFEQNMTLVRLSSVCNRWRQTAIGDGTLWSNISFSPSLASTVECATEFLRRSRGASLTLAVWNEAFSDPVINPATKGLLTSLVRVTNRITALLAVNPPDVVIQALESSAANLGYLNVQIAESREIPTLFGGEMPKLETLCISNPSGWKIAQFRQLHTVHISATSWKPWRLSTLLDCLEGTVVLGELHLACFEDFEFEPGAEAERTVTFSALLVLRLTYCDSGLILSRLEIPRSTALSIYSYCQQSEEILACFPESPRFLGILEKVQLLTVVFDVEKQVFEVEIMGPEDVHILIGAVPRLGRFERKWALRSMTAVARFTPVSGVKWLTMVVDEQRMPWKVWLSKFSQVSILEVRCPDPEELLNALIATDSNTGGVICPSLRSLSLERSRRPTVASSHLRECLMTRAAAGHALSQLSLNDLDWSVVAASELEAWESLINRTQLDGTVILSAFDRLLTKTCCSYPWKFHTEGGPLD